jgi:hypothetical protein
MAQAVMSTHTGYLLLRPRVDLKPLRVGFVVDIVTLGQALF